MENPGPNLPLEESELVQALVNRATARITDETKRAVRTTRSLCIQVFVFGSGVARLSDATETVSSL
jgi:hypothetical protein